MPSLLAITSSPRGDQSVSNNLVRTFVDAWKQAHAGGNVKTRDLQATDLPFINPAWMADAYTPAEQHSPDMKQALAISDELIAELKATDHIVLGTPMYNFNTPAIVKAWIDHVVRLNQTFNASYEGLPEKQEGDRHHLVWERLHPGSTGGKLQRGIRLPEADPGLCGHRYPDHPRGRQSGDQHRPDHPAGSPQAVRA